MELYCNILGFLLEADHIYDMSLVRRITHSMLNLGAVDDFIGTCGTLEDRVEKEAQNYENILDENRHKETTQAISNLKQMLRTLEEPIVRIDNQVAFMFESSINEKQSSILQWISNIPYQANHETACQGRTDGTGTWLLDRSQYLEWRISSASLILWLHGPRECPLIFIYEEWCVNIFIKPGQEKPS